MRPRPRRSITALALLFAAPSCGDSTSGGTPSETGDPTSGGSDATTEPPTSDGSGGATTDTSTSEASSDSTTDAETLPAPTESVSFTESDEDILNPERGFYRYVDVVGQDDLSWVRDSGHTLAYSYVRLDDWRTEPLPASLLMDTSEGIGAARDAGLKLILRFAYNFGPYPDSEPDTSLAWVLDHLAQVEPLLAAEADVVSILQAGFIGAWGEWHTSTNGLLDDRELILDTILSTLPGTRSTQLRYPPYKGERWEPLTAAEAFTDLPAARVGHHNDCFLASDTDLGTYPGDEVEQWKSYLELDTLYVPMGGETCALNPPRSECATALEEMERFHFSYINADYHPDVLESWDAGGCMAEIRRKLGYRLVLRAAELAPVARPGGWFEFELELDNLGWAGPYNPRPVVLVLDGPGGRYEAPVEIEIRRWGPGTQVLAGALRLPSDATPGEYLLALALPDADPGLAQDPRYAIQAANVGTWADGLNVLGSISLDREGPGDNVDGQAFELVE